MSALNGTYELDSKRSESTEDFLAAQDVGWAKRKIANNMSQTITITVEGDEVSIQQVTTMANNTVKLTLGGDYVEFVDDLTGEKAKRKAFLSGDAIVVESIGSKGTTTITRTVEEDGKVLHATIEFVGAKTLKINRYFNRK